MISGEKHLPTWLHTAARPLGIGVEQRSDASVTLLAALRERSEEKVFHESAGILARTHDDKVSEVVGTAAWLERPVQEVYKRTKCVCAELNL